MRPKQRIDAANGMGQYLRSKFLQLAYAHTADYGTPITQSIGFTKLLMDMVGRTKGVDECMLINGDDPKGGFIYIPASDMAEHSFYMAGTSGILNNLEEVKIVSSGQNEKMTQIFIDGYKKNRLSDKIKFVTNGEKRAIPRNEFFDHFGLDGDYNIMGFSGGYLLQRNTNKKVENWLNQGKKDAVLLWGPSVEVPVYVFQGTKYNKFFSIDQCLENGRLCSVPGKLNFIGDKQSYEKFRQELMDGLGNVALAPNPFIPPDKVRPWRIDVIGPVADPAIRKMRENTIKKAQMNGWRIFIAGKEVTDMDYNQHRDEFEIVTEFGGKEAAVFRPALIEATDKTEKMPWDTPALKEKFSPDLHIARHDTFKSARAQDSTNPGGLCTYVHGLPGNDPRILELRNDFGSVYVNQQARHVKNYDTFDYWGSNGGPVNSPISGNVKIKGKDGELKTLIEPISMFYTIKSIQDGSLFE